MAKNLMKKGLAVIATSALGVAGLVVGATPAYAAGELKLESSAGTVMAVSADEAFTLKTSFVPGNSSSESALLHYKVTDVSSTPGQKQINYAANNSEGSVDEHTELTSTAIATNDSDNSAVVAGTGSADAVQYAGFAVTAASTSSTYKITVQAFIDSDGDNVMDDGEWNSNEVTITFLKHTSVGFDVTMSGVTRQSTAVQVRATSSVVNIQQMYNDATTEGSKFIVDLDDNANFGNDVDSTDVLATYDSVNKWLEADFTPAALAASESVRATMYLVNGSADGMVEIENAQVSTSSALTTRIQSVGVATIQAGAADVTVVDNMDVSDATAGTNAASFAAGSGSFAVTTAITYASGYGAGDTTVTWTVTEQGANTIQADGSVTAGGVTLVNNLSSGDDQLIRTTTGTDADGVATLVVSYAGLDAGDKFQISADIEGTTAAELTLTGVARALTTVENTNAIGTNNDSAELVFPTGADVVLTYAAVDQFGKAWTTAGGNITVTFNGNSGTGAIANGVATVAVPAFDADETGSFTTSTTTNYNGSGAGVTEPNVEVTIGTQATATAVTATGNQYITAGTYDGVLNLKDPKNADTRKGEAAPSVTASSNATITGTVTDADLNPIAANVTLSSPGAMFEADGVWSLDSITVRSTASGAYTAELYSNKAGDITVTVTAGSGSATEVLYYAAAADSKGTSLTVTAPSYVLPGSTLQIKGALTDKFGNGVDAGGTNTSAAGADFKITYTGPGLLVGTTPTSTDADGNANVNYLLGQNDSGSITVTYSYDANGDADYKDSGDLVVTKTITIGTEPAAKKVNAGSFKGYVAVYAKGYEGQRLSAKIGNDWVIVDPIVNNQENGTLHRTVDFTGAGVDITVRIYIDRVLTATIPLTTK